MVMRFFFFSIFLFSCQFYLLAQHKQYHLLFYNLENCFDCFDDSLNSGDDEYLPQSDKHWTYNRYKKKLNNISKVILASGEWNPPAIIGVCEVESKSVLKQLIWWTGLKEQNYRCVHFESPDRRGIDVALLYRKDCFKPLESEPINVNLGGKSRTRDILMVKGVLKGFDTIRVFVNHWPSRYGGVEYSEPRRLKASNRFIEICDSIKHVDPDTKMVVMGDFNDSPINNSIINLVNSGFVNMANSSETKFHGSNKYRYQWELIDQILISTSLAADSCVSSFKVIELPFLLEKDITYMGEKPFRTYQGPIYKGGYSDHLPVRVTINLNE